MILEQILRVTGFYKNLVDEHEFLDVIFKQAKTGKIDSLFKNDEVRKAVYEKLTNLTGLPEKYWSGEERIKLDIKCTEGKLKIDGNTIDKVDLSDDDANDGKSYQDMLKNPLNVIFGDIHCKTFGLRRTDKFNRDTKKIIDEVIGEIYSLRGLLAVILLNMADEIELIDKANVYEHKKWEPYISKLAYPTEHGITYSPKFVEIKKGLVQTIIMNLFDLGIPFTFRDYFKKEFKI